MRRRSSLVGLTRPGRRPLPSLSAARAAVTMGALDDRRGRCADETAGNRRADRRMEHAACADGNPDLGGVRGGRDRRWLAGRRAHAHRQPVGRRPDGPRRADHRRRQVPEDGVRECAPREPPGHDRRPRIPVGGRRRRCDALAQRRRAASALAVAIARGPRLRRRPCRPRRVRSPRRCLDGGASRRAAPGGGRRPPEGAPSVHDRRVRRRERRLPARSHDGAGLQERRAADAARHPHRARVRVRRARRCGRPRAPGILGRARERWPRPRGEPRRPGERQHAVDHPAHRHGGRGRLLALLPAPGARGGGCACGRAA